MLSFLIKYQKRIADGKNSNKVICENVDTFTLPLLRLKELRNRSINGRLHERTKHHINKGYSKEA